MPLIHLTPPEICVAIDAAKMRQVDNIKLGRRPYHGAGDGNDWQLHCEGCLGEMALAKWLGIYWGGKGQFREPDVGEVDVRTTRYDDGRLLLHDEDPDGRRVWLLTGINGAYDVRGWLFARDGKKKEFWPGPNPKRPCYGVPQSALNPPTRYIITRDHPISA